MGAISASANGLIAYRSGAGSQRQLAWFDRTGKALGGQGPQYDVARDGRFLINTVLDEASSAPITLIQNWRPPAE